MQNEVGRYEIERAGQQSPVDGDEVAVTVTVYLPTTERKLIPEIQYGSRLQICGASLLDDWGFPAPATDER